MDKPRCQWVTDDLLYITYHDEEWGSFSRFYDDHYLFEMLTLEGAQAGLSWLQILKRREHYRQAFAEFNPYIVSQFNQERAAELLQNEGIIRHRGKIESTINNAQAFVRVQKEFGNFYHYLTEFFSNNIPIKNEWSSATEVPTQTAQSEKLSKDLRKRGFTFVGPVICYSFMQAVGIVQDHTKNCWLFHE